MAKMQPAGLGIYTTDGFGSMLTLYVICAILGGGLILLSALGALGGHDVSHDLASDTGDFSHDFATDSGSADGADHDVSHDAGPADHDVDSSGPNMFTDALAAFLSLRFWTYLIGTFGLLGTILTATRSAPDALIPLYAMGAAIPMGFLAASLYRVLQRAQTSSSASYQDFLGAEAKVLVAIRGESPGRIRMEMRDETIDMVAVGEEGRQFDVGEQVFVVGLDAHRAKVARREDVFE